MAKAWKLLNAEDWSAKYPSTFKIPPHNVRHGLSPGDHAKLVFETRDGGGERMWVEITSSPAPGKYVGKLANKPFLIEDLFLGYELEFHAHHIINVKLKTEKN